MPSAYFWASLVLALHVAFSTFRGGLLWVGCASVVPPLLHVLPQALACPGLALACLAGCSPSQHLLWDT